MAYTCPGCGQTDEEKKNCCGGEMEEDKEKNTEEESAKKGPSNDKDIEDEFEKGDL